jgi:hypothetical protein
MSRAPLFTLCASLLILAAGCSNDHPSAVHAADYYPLAVDDTWTYRMSPGTKVYSATITSSRMIGNAKTYAVAVEDTYSFLAEQEGGVYQYGQGDPDNPNKAVVFDPPQLVYKLPFQIGDEWETPALSDAGEKNGETVYVNGQVDGEETVTVPAGVFPHCFRVSIDDPRDAPADRTDLWFAPNVGIVKTETYIAVGAGKPKTTTTELVKYHLVPK